MTATESITQRIRRVLEDHSRIGNSIEQIDGEENLYEAGMTSLASVNVMLALEAEFNIEFPDEMLRRDVFESIASISAAVGTLADG